MNTFPATTGSVFFGSFHWKRSRTSATSRAVAPSCRIADAGAPPAWRAARLIIFLAMPLTGPLASSFFSSFSSFLRRKLEKDAIFDADPRRPVVSPARSAAAWAGPGSCNVGVFRARAFEDQRLCVATVPRDDRSSKNQPKRVGNDPRYEPPKLANVAPFSCPGRARGVPSARKARPRLARPSEEATRARRPARFSEQRPPDLPYAALRSVDYKDLPSDLKCFAGLNVGVVGGGNSAFEVAALLRDHAAQTYARRRARSRGRARRAARGARRATTPPPPPPLQVLPRGDLRLAHESHYPGDARSVHLGFLDQFYLKSMDALLPPRYANGVLTSEKRHHDHVIRAQLRPCCKATPYCH